MLCPITHDPCEMCQHVCYFERTNLPTLYFEESTAGHKDLTDDGVQDMPWVWEENRPIG